MTDDLPRGRRRRGFNVLATTVLGFHILVGGIAAALVLMFGAPDKGVVVIALKAAALASYLAGIVLGAIAWNKHHWGIVALPVLSLGTPFLIVLLGNELASWGLPIGH